ncbi:ATP-binding cassette domain-containing protein [Siccirubricoccus deserti]|uniref:ATP-binding cassette domain-containing protein n=1 Tax=Siccirubricoccus deserti TaxID=2013562 RepID=A0A9X0R0W6_9PROT|nr:ATP-binding cassette domain-containing protein [Siccirubricoccus deserti]MBC4017491.1 ATP-binding cassette domain-containing protein [Siccirubricoccus deserti]
MNRPPDNSGKADARGGEGRATDRPRAEPARRLAQLRPSEFGMTPFTLLLLLLLTLGHTCGQLAFVLFLKHLSDGVIESGNTATLTGLTLLFVAAMIAAAIYGHLRSAMLGAAAERFGLRLRMEAMQAAIRNAVRTDVSAAVAILRDIATVQRFFSSRTPAALLDVIGAVAAVAVLFYLDVWLGIIVVTGIVISSLLGLVMLRATRPIMAESKRRLDNTSAELGGQFLHPDMVRGIGLLPATLLRWHGKYANALDSMDASRRRSDALQELESFISSLTLMACSIRCFWLVVDHTATVGLLLATMLLVSMATGPFSGLFSSWESWGNSVQAWRRLREAMRQDGAPEVHPPEPEAATGLLIEGLGFWPEGRPKPILTGINLRVAPGTMMTVQGPNGVGKSTLLRLVLGLMPPTTGRVLLDGQDTWHCDRAELGARIGYLPQDVQLLEGDVFRNIGRGPDAAPDDVVAAARAAGAHEMIGRLPLGYQTPAGGTSGISAGQRRLIGLARALYRDPALVVMDEPEVGLDGHSRSMMRRAVEAAKARGAVVLVVTHEPRTWNDVTDLRLLLERDGTWQVRPAEQDADIMGGSLATVD